MVIHDHLGNNSFQRFHTRVPVDAKANFTFARVDNSLIPSATLTKYFDIYGRKEPVTTNHTPLCFGMGDLDTTAWDLFSKDPERLRVFLTGMKLLANFMPVTDAYGFTWVVERSRECHEERILLVDIGAVKLTLLLPFAMKILVF